MTSLLVLMGATALLAAARAAGVARLHPWPVVLRGGLAAMFVVTGLSHFVGMREDLIAMVPPGLPAPAVLVTVTGVLELLGAAGLLWHRTAPWAAGGLALLLVAMFPANVHAALAGLTLDGAPATPLLPRTAMQVLYVAVALTIVVAHVRRARANDRALVSTP
jgi:uncharacterized membrane protein